MADARTYLGISIALNIFLLGSIGGAAYWFAGGQRMIMAGSLRVAGSELPLKERRAFRRSLHEARASMTSELGTARAARIRAAQLLSQPDVDVAAVSAALDQARAAEVAIRVAIERRALDFMTTLSLEDRRNLAEAIERRGKPAPGEAD